ncbi:MAG: hypothetical protein ACRD01_07240 [Terriglobales bacterium]
MRRSSWWLGLALLGASVAAAQTPPANAKDINPSQTATTASTPSAVIAASPNVVRVYISNLSGADAAALNGLITQTLFQSQQVVVTTNQSNASLILQGRVLRLPIAASKSASAKRRRPRAKPADSGPVVTDITALGDSGNAGAPNSSTLAGDDAALSGLGLGMGTPDDLSHYHYQLQLQAVNPGGDLVWMSAQGDGALPFMPAEQAVGQTLASFLKAISAMKSPQP